jgi:hypothetical protein
MKEKTGKYMRFNFSYLAIAVGFLALFVLTASLPYFEFKPGQASELQKQEQTIKPIRVALDSTFLTSICLAGILVMMPAGVVLLIFSSEARRLFRRYSRVLLIYFLILLGLRYYLILAGDSGDVDNSTGRNLERQVFDQPPSVLETVASSEDAYIPPEVIGWQAYLVGLIIMTILILGGYVLWKKNRIDGNDLGDITLRAIEDIHSGRRWEDAVIECYAQMNTSVSRKRSINRDQTMTPSEFSRRLIDSGLPVEPVLRLTHLFEQARYGGRDSRTWEARDAIRCLSDINQALGGGN